MALVNSIKRFLMRRVYFFAIRRGLVRSLEGFFPLWAASDAIYIGPSGPSATVHPELLALRHIVSRREVTDDELYAQLSNPSPWVVGYCFEALLARCSPLLKVLPEPLADRNEAVCMGLGCFRSCKPLCSYVTNRLKQEIEPEKTDSKARSGETKSQVLKMYYLDKNWSELTHAYGSAEDVPKCLAQLNDADEQTRDDAFSELFGSIWHQGTVYPATVKALPELIALFRSPDCKDRESMAILIASIADGKGYYHVHGSLDYERRSARRSSFIAEEIEREAAFLKVIREMSLEVLPLLEPFLDASESYTRECIVGVFRRYSEHIPEARTRLEKRLSVETDEEVRGRIEAALVEIKESRHGAVG